MLCKVMFTKGDEVMCSVKKKKACKKAVWFEIVFNLLVLNVEHLLKLSDEYEINHVFESCLSFLKKQPKLKQNVMKLRKMAAMYNLKGVLDGCEDFLKNMKLKTLREIVDFKDLDKETLQHFHGAKDWATRRVRWSSLSRIYGSARVCDGKETVWYLQGTY